MASQNIVVILLLAFGFLVIGGVWVSSRPKPHHHPEKDHSEDNKKPSFKINNYLPNHRVRVAVLEAVNDKYPGAEIPLVDQILPKSSGGLKKEMVVKYLKAGNILRFYVSKECTPLDEKHYVDYLINTDCGERIKNLHVGMITTRTIGSTDVYRMGTVNGNAIQGPAMLKIHNLTNLPLRLDDGLVVRPKDVEIYTGYFHQGVTLGTYFNDQDELYPQFQYLEPQTDLYYGVVSDIRQSLSGCQQLTFNDYCEYGQTLWPFEEGVL